MFDATINFTALLVAALIVGAMFGVWLIFDPAGLDAGTYISQQQIGIRKLNTVMPLLGGLSIVLAAVAAIVARDDRARVTLLITAVICFIAAGVITRFGNQPINTIVMTWQAGSVPTDWTQFRDAWWRWHNMRLCCGLVGLSLMIVATLIR